MIETILLVGGIFIYGLVGMVVGVAAYRLGDSSDKEFVGGACGIFWPIGMWVAIGMYVVNRLESRDNERDKRQREEEELLRKEGML